MSEELMIKAASELVPGDLTVLGIVTEVEEVEAEYAGEKPIGANPEYKVTFDSGEERQFSALEPFSVVED